MRRLLSSVALAAAFLCAPAYAQSPPCGPHDEIVKVLTGKYQEKPAAMGLVNPQMVMETYLSPQGTWTIFLTNDKGVSCLIASGGDFEFIASPTEQGEPM